MNCICAANAKWIEKLRCGLCIEHILSTLWVLMWRKKMYAVVYHPQTVGGYLPYVGWRKCWSKVAMTSRNTNGFLKALCGFMLWLVCAGGISFYLKKGNRANVKALVTHKPHSDRKNAASQSFVAPLQNLYCDNNGMVQHCYYFKQCFHHMFGGDPMRTARQRSFQSTPWSFFAPLQLASTLVLISVPLLRRQHPHKRPLLPQ